MIRQSLLAYWIAGLLANGAFAAEAVSDDPSSGSTAARDDSSIAAPVSPASGNDPSTPPAPSAKTSAPHSRPVLVLDGPLPASVRYEFIAQVKIREGGYRSSEQNQDRALARRARALGADAVIDVKRWRQPAGWSWAAPHADGSAVRILNKEDLGDLSRLGPLY